MRNRITQKQLAFYKLYIERKLDPTRYVNTWEFGGEILIKEFGKWGLMTYKCPTRLTDIFQENPWLLKRERITGKSGSKYYAYRFADNASMELIEDPSLREFYRKIKMSAIPVDNSACIAN